MVSRTMTVSYVATYWLVWSGDFAYLFKGITKHIFLLLSGTRPIPWKMLNNYFQIINLITGRMRGSSNSECIFCYLMFDCLDVHFCFRTTSILFRNYNCLVSVPTFEFFIQFWTDTLVFCNSLFWGAYTIYVYLFFNYGSILLDGRKFMRYKMNWNLFFRPSMELSCSEQSFFKRAPMHVSPAFVYNVNGSFKSRCATRGTDIVAPIISKDRWQSSIHLNLVYFLIRLNQCCCESGRSSDKSSIIFCSVHKSSNFSNYSWFWHWSYYLDHSYIRFNPFVLIIKTKCFCLLLGKLIFL